MFVISRNNSDKVGDNSCTLDANITTGVEYTVSFKYNFIAGSLNDTVYFGVYNGKYTLKDGLRIVAGKTGHTNAAGFCLVLSEEDNEGKRYNL